MPDTLDIFIFNDSTVDEHLLQQVFEREGIDVTHMRVEVQENMAGLISESSEELVGFYGRKERKDVELALAESAEQYRAIVDGIEQAGTGLMIVDYHQAIHFMNGVMICWFGDQQYKRVNAAFDVTVIEAMFSPVEEIFVDHQRRQFDVCLGNLTYYRVIATPIKAIGGGEDGSATPRCEKVLMMVQDVTEERRVEHKLSQAAAVFDSAAEGVIITDTRFLISATNEAFSVITGYGATEAMGVRPTMVPSTDCLFSKLREIRHQLKKHPQWEGELWSRRKNSEIFPCRVTISKVINNEGDIENYVFVFTDISTIKNSQDQLVFLANHDPLTKLPNRLLLLDRIQQALSRAKRHDRSIAILYIDLDRFKNINESLGHIEGDHLLMLVAERLSKLIRKEDTLARLGGDEFIILIEDVASPDVVSNFANKVLTMFSNSFLLDGADFYISASIGITLYPDDGDNPEQLIENADTAMYRVKEQGKDTYQFYTPDMNARTLELLRLENDLRRAVENQQFELFYQPQFDIKSNRLIGMEALVRWFHPTKGMVSPVEFIPLSEEIGTIIPIGEWVIRSACFQLKAWQEKYGKALTVAVNLSPRQFGHHHLIPCVDESLRSSGLSPSSLEIEITEGVLVEDVQAAIDVLEKFKNMGIKTSIDDFGTGYSSLAYLKRFPISKLKIDQSFVKDIRIDSNDEAIVTSIIRLGQSMDMQVIAEGVETDSQLQFLLDQGCDEGQGYLLGHPRSAKDFEEEFLC